MKPKKKRVNYLSKEIREKPKKNKKKEKERMKEEKAKELIKKEVNTKERKEGPQAHFISKCSLISPLI